MEIVHSIAEVRERVARAHHKGQRVGLVPTMGALHAGHGSLIETAVAETDFVVVSVFVNPLQFGPSEDFDRYPRTLESDAAFCQRRGADVVFAPAANEMYPKPQVTYITVEELTTTLCGVTRPGHFRGVATVVTKLFHIVQPDVAFFGQKDAQQVAVVRRMVHDLNFPLEIRVVPTVREADGVAMSSRNAYLSSEDRQAAVVLNQSLQDALALLEHGERDADRVRRFLMERISAEPRARIDYAEVVDPETMQPLHTIEQAALLAVAVYFGNTRLIDNAVFAVESYV